jgi:hypothetical protein
VSSQVKQPNRNQCRSSAHTPSTINCAVKAGIRTISLDSLGEAGLAERRLELRPSVSGGGGFFRLTTRRQHACRQVPEMDHSRRMRTPRACPSGTCAQRIPREGRNGREWTEGQVGGSTMFWSSSQSRCTLRQLVRRVNFGRLGGRPLPMTKYCKANQCAAWRRVSFGNLSLDASVPWAPSPDIAVVQQCRRGVRCRCGRFSR